MMARVFIRIPILQRRLCSVDVLPDYNMTPNDKQGGEGGGVGVLPHASKGCFAVKGLNTTEQNTSGVSHRNQESIKNLVWNRN